MRVLPACQRNEERRRQREVGVDGDVIGSSGDGSLSSGRDTLGPQESIATALDRGEEEGHLDVEGLLASRPALAEGELLAADVAIAAVW